MKDLFEKIFLSCVWFFEPRRYPANWAKHFPSTAQLAGYLLSLKNYMHERNVFSKQSFWQTLWKNQQLLLMQSCFNFVPYSPYYQGLDLKKVEGFKAFKALTWKKLKAKALVWTQTILETDESSRPWLEKTQSSRQ